MIMSSDRISPGRLQEMESRMCDIIARLYELQRDFDSWAAPEMTTEFDNAIIDCVNACTTVAAERIRLQVLES